MDRRVAVDAAARQHAVAAVVQLVLVVDGRRVPRVVVAALAEHGLLRDEHALVRRAVRVVATRAVVTHGGVLVQERAALLRVAADAGLVEPVAHLQQLDVGGAVRVVARRALHLALGDRHVRGATHLRRLLLVAGLAQLGLRVGLQLALERLGRVRAVARRAGHVPGVVRAAVPHGVRALGVAREAGLVARPRVGLGVAEPQDLALVVVVHVGLPRAVTALAATVGRWRARVLDTTVGRLADRALGLVALQAHRVAGEARRRLASGQRRLELRRAGDQRGVRRCGRRQWGHGGTGGARLRPHDTLLIGTTPGVDRHDGDRHPHREHGNDAGPRTYCSPHVSLQHLAATRFIMSQPSRQGRTAGTAPRSTS